MRVSDLIGLDVHDAASAYLGVVTDLRCVQDGPLRGSMQAPRVSALIVGRRHLGSLLGYDRRAQQGPWLVRVIVQRLHRHNIMVPWDAVAGTDGHVILHADPEGIEDLFGRRIGAKVD
ncbi:MAG: PRC-barrel domain containing protein [Geodermatophilaceae bacterium]|nr:PRC-barrel domain containing protein [Geodermatophilaceae bacterium]